MSKLLAYLVGYFFLLYGLVFLIFPVEMATLVTNSSPNTQSGIIDLRATYGGLQIAVGAAIVLLMKLKYDLELVLTLIALILFSMAFGRILGMLKEGEPNTIMYLYLIAEWVFGSVAWYLRVQAIREKQR